MSGVAAGADAPSRGRAGDGTPKRAGLVLGALIAVAAVANLGLAVANVALPSIGKQFDASQTALNLVAVGYSLGLAASVLYFGAVGDRYGRKLLLVLGMVLTIPADCLAAWAPSIEVLFGARVLGGLAAGMAYPTTLALITALWSGPARTQVDRALGGDRRCDRGARPALRRGSCSSTSGGARSSCSRCRSALIALVMARAARARPRERGDRAGRPPRRRALVVLVGALILGDQLRAGAERDDARDRAVRGRRRRRWCAFFIRQRRAREPALRPARGGAADLLGRRLRRA